MASGMCGIGPTRVAGVHRQPDGHLRGIVVDPRSIAAGAAVSCRAKGGGRRSHESTSMSSGRSSSTPTVMNTHSGSVRTALLAPGDDLHDHAGRRIRNGGAKPAQIVHLMRGTGDKAVQRCLVAGKQGLACQIRQHGAPTRFRFDLTARVEKVGGFARLHMQSAGLRIQRTPF